MIDIQCPWCDSPLQADDSAAGSKISCDICCSEVDLPQAHVEPAATEANVVEAAVVVDTSAPEAKPAAEPAPKSSKNKRAVTGNKGGRAAQGGKAVRNGRSAKAGKGTQVKKRRSHAPVKKQRGPARAIIAVLVVAAGGLVWALSGGGDQAGANAALTSGVAATGAQAQAGVGPYDTPEMDAAIKRIDGIIAKYQKEAGVAYNEPVDDETFLRRAYLDITGAIATYDDAVSFLQDKSPDKRKELVAKLLNDEGYTSHTFNYMADLWRVKTVVQPNNLRTDAYIHWLKQQIRENKPYSQIVYDQMTAEGRLWQNPATGWHMRDTGTKLDHVAYMTKSLMGTDISCAQCHDDPFDDWTQLQYYEFSAYLSELTTFDSIQGRHVLDMGGKFGKMVVDPDNPEAEELREMIGVANMPMETEEEIENVRRRANNWSNDYRRDILQAYRLNVRDEHTTKLYLPKTYKYDDAKGGSEVTPRVLIGKELGWLPGLKPRAKIARWVTSDDNKRFAQNLGNHMWARMFGRAAVEPLHDFEVEESDMPELIEALGEEVVNFNHDLKAITWLVVNTRAYQSKATPTFVNVTDDYYFQGPLVRRLSAEQIWDTFVTLAVKDPMRFRAPDGEEYHQIVDLAAEEHKMEMPPKVMINRLKALRDYNNSGTLVDTHADSSPVAAKKSSGGGDQMMMMMMGAGRNKKKVYLTRASELAQPADFSHFLHKFGQSERNYQVGAASREGSVPQLMESMNGYATEFVCGRKSMVNENVRRTILSAERASTVFLTILNRRPTKQELEELGKLPKNDETISNLIWALLNTPEFFFTK